ncbi:MAG: FliM/FliN family flagellar motor switch protein [Gammaproteobacteria bacterium]|nr:FliM/FliN family flagellar motor switch protein [Gammaproteobacteria bacterium]
MTDPVLTDDEKDALLDGMSSGDVEVTSASGVGYADVSEFEVGPRSRIRTNSFPRLQSLNRQFASRMGKQVELLLNAESAVVFNHVRTCTYSEFSEQIKGLSLVLEFAPKPLDGSALMNIDSVLLELLVETFYGGAGNDSDRPEAEFFTPGETSVATLFCNSVINVTAEVWQPMANFNPETLGAFLSSGVIDSIDGSDAVIVCEFELSIGEKTRLFHILWPTTTVASLLPVFEGQKRDRDAAEDARWAESLQSRVVESIVNISSSVGKTEMTLREVAELVPGDIINIANPQKSTVFARQVPILEGRFGVHDGRHAVETTQWLEPEIGSDPTTH